VAHALYQFPQVRTSLGYGSHHEWISLRGSCQLVGVPRRRTGVGPRTGFPAYFGDAGRHHPHWPYQRRQVDCCRLARQGTRAASRLLILYYFLGFVVCAQIGGWMPDRIGAKTPVVLGCILAAAGFGLWASRATDLHVSAQVVFIVMAGAGMGLMLGQANTDAINRASRASYGEATGITQTVRN
jgi:MFS family permease